MERMGLLARKNNFCQITLIFTRNKQLNFSDDSISQTPYCLPSFGIWITITIRRFSIVDRSWVCPNLQSVVVFLQKRQKHIEFKDILICHNHVNKKKRL